MALPWAEPGGAGRRPWHTLWAVSRAGPGHRNPVLVVALVLTCRRTSDTCHLWASVSSPVNKRLWAGRWFSSFGKKKKKGSGILSLRKILLEASLQESYTGSLWFKVWGCRMLPTYPTSPGLSKQPQGENHQVSLVSEVHSESLVIKPTSRFKPDIGILGNLLHLSEPWFLSLNLVS